MGYFSHGTRRMLKAGSAELKQPLEDYMKDPGSRCLALSLLACGFYPYKCKAAAALAGRVHETGRRRQEDQRVLPFYL